MLRIDVSGRRDDSRDTVTEWDSTATAGGVAQGA
jgi:hypothetical protein